MKYPIESILYKLITIIVKGDFIPLMFTELPVNCIKFQSPTVMQINFVLWRTKWNLAKELRC